MNERIVCEIEESCWTLNKRTFNKRTGSNNEARTCPTCWIACALTWTTFCARRCLLASNKCRTPFNPTSPGAPTCGPARLFSTKPSLRRSSSVSFFCLIPSPHRCWTLRHHRWSPPTCARMPWFHHKLLNSCALTRKAPLARSRPLALPRKPRSSPSTLSRGP